jgi:hypothetical protein
MLTLMGCNKLSRSTRSIMGLTTLRIQDLSQAIHSSWAIRLPANRTHRRPANLTRRHLATLTRRHLANRTHRHLTSNRILS